MSGFYGLRRSLFHPPVPMHRGYHMLPYLLVIFSGTKIREVPYTFGCRMTGASKVTQNLGFIRIFLGQMLVTFRIRSANKHPPVSRRQAVVRPTRPEKSPAPSVASRSPVRLKAETNLSGVFGGPSPTRTGAHD